MIPSDHFVRFYNEIFKFLDEHGNNVLEHYWETVSAYKEKYLLDLFKTKGLAGMYEYWEKIRIEENCDLKLELNENYLSLRMFKCPSLTKVMDNDALPCEKYCDHCFGWIAPLMAKAGFCTLFDIISRDIPQCDMFVYKDKELALKHYERLKAKDKDENVKLRLYKS